MSKLPFRIVLKRFAREIKNAMTITEAVIEFVLWFAFFMAIGLTLIEVQSIHAELMELLDLLLEQHGTN